MGSSLLKVRVATALALLALPPGGCSNSDAGAAVDASADGQALPDLAAPEDVLAPPADVAALPKDVIELTTRDVALGYRALHWDGQAFIALWVERGAEDMRQQVRVARIAPDGRLLLAPRSLLFAGPMRYEHSFYDSGTLALWWLNPREETVYAATASLDPVSVSGPRELTQGTKLSVTAVPGGYDTLTRRSTSLNYVRFSPELVAQQAPQKVLSNRQAVLFWDATAMNHIVLYRLDGAPYYRTRLDPEDIVMLDGAGSKLADTGTAQRSARIFRDSKDHLLYLWQERGDTATTFVYEGESRIWGPRYLTTPNRVADNELCVAEARDRIWVAWTSDESLRQVKLGSFAPAAPQAELQEVTQVSGGPRACKPALAAGAETVALLFTSTYGGAEHLLLRLF